MSDYPPDFIPKGARPFVSIDNGAPDGGWVVRGFRDGSGVLYVQQCDKLEFTMRRVVCAAIRAVDGSLLLGIRHYSRDMHEQIRQRDDGGLFKHRNDEHQGFVDQFGVYMTREEAYQVAVAAGQLLYPERCGNGLNGPKLYSEGLY